MSKTSIYSVGNEQSPFDHGTHRSMLYFNLGENMTASVEGQRLTIELVGSSLDLSTPASELHQHLVRSGIPQQKAERLVDKAMAGIAAKLAFDILKSCQIK